jgi:hypothetical protein
MGAIQRVVLYDRRQGIEPDDVLLPLAVRTFVELSDRSGTLGLGDHERIGWLSRLFRVEAPVIGTLWGKATAEATAHRERIETAALARFREGGEATMRLGRRVQAQELSAALRLTKIRKKAIFTAPRGIENGRIAFGKRPSSGLPDYVPVSENAATNVPMVAAWSCTKVERRYLIDRLGYKAGTIRRNRKLPEDEFWFRAIKRESETMPADKLVGLKLPGESDWHASRRIRSEAPNTRTRKPGITEARRRYAKAHDMGMTKAKELTKGLSVEAVLAQIPPHFVTPATRYGCNARPDKKGGNPAFSPKISCHQGSKQGERYDDSETPVTELSDFDLAILERWYLCIHGKALKSGTIHQPLLGSIIARLHVALPISGRSVSERLLGLDLGDCVLHVL